MTFLKGDRVEAPEFEYARPDGTKGNVGGLWIVSSVWPTGTEGFMVSLHRPDDKRARRNALASELVKVPRGRSEVPRVLR